MLQETLASKTVQSNCLRVQIFLDGAKGVLASAEDASYLHVALIDHRTCGGEEQMLALAKAYVKACHDVFFFLFLAFKPFCNAGRATKSKAEQRIAEKKAGKDRFLKVIRRFGHRCTVGFLDDVVITLSKLILKDGSALLANVQSALPSEIRKDLQKPVETIVAIIQALYDAEPFQGRCFAQAVQSEELAVVLVGLIGYGKEDTVKLRRLLAELWGDTEFLLVTASVSADDTSHLSFGTVSLSTDLQVIDSWQKGSYVDCIIHIGQSFKCPSQDFSGWFDSRERLTFVEVDSCAVVCNKPVALSQTVAKEDSQPARQKIYDSMEMAWCSIADKLLSLHLQTRRVTAMNDACLMRDQKFKASLARQNLLAAGDRHRIRNMVAVPAPEPQAAPKQTMVEVKETSTKPKKKGQSERRKAALRRRNLRESHENTPTQRPPESWGGKPTDNEDKEDDAFSEIKYREWESGHGYSSSTSTKLPNTEVEEMTDPDMAEPVHPQNLLAAELQAALWSACLTRGTIHVGREPKSVVAAAQQKTAEKTAQTPAGFTLLIGEEESALTRGTIHVGREPKSVVAASQQKTAEKTAQTPSGFTLLIGEEESAPRDKQPIEWCSSQMVFRSALV
jgi:hypothetical protein